MTGKELYDDWSKRMDTSTIDMIRCTEQGAVSQDYLDGFVEAVKTSMNTLELILTEQQ